MEQKKKTAKFSFNFVDLILTLVIIASVITLVSYLTERKIVTPGSSEKTEITYFLEFSPTREEFRGLVEIGDTVTDPEFVTQIGKVVNVSYSPYYYIGRNQDGDTVRTQYPGKISMTLEITTSAEKGLTSYNVSGRNLVIGNELEVRVPSFTGIGKIVSITETPEDK